MMLNWNWTDWIYENASRCPAVLRMRKEGMEELYYLRRLQEEKPRNV